jgi:amidophosphoribosyltransferase
MIADELDLHKILSRSMKDLDGGYVMTGMIGHGDAFVIRDPNGIRPAYWYQDDEVVVVASERPAIQTTFNVPEEKILEIAPGHAVIIKKNGQISHLECAPPKPKRSCSFERIYFSRGNDKDIYQERKKLGHLLTPTVLNAVNHDLENTIFSYIPNTAETAYYGLVDGILDHLKTYRKDEIKRLGANITEEQLDHIFNMSPRLEKLAVKDIKLRTFITDDSSRNELVSHVYDVTYGLIRKGVDTIVALDDSIVRGTTLQQSILSIFDRLGPKKIIIVSSAPQIRYPDCYGIDMSRMQEFVAFRAAIALLQDTGQGHIIKDTFEKCRAANLLPLHEVRNEVKAIYAPFTPEQISAKAAELLKPKHIFSDVQIIFQTIENLHVATPEHLGDWYFSGDYPTPGGNRVVNQSFMNYYEGKDKRAY